MKKIMQQRHKKQSWNLVYNFKTMWPSVSEWSSLLCSLNSCKGTGFALSMNREQIHSGSLKLLLRWPWTESCVFLNIFETKGDDFFVAHNDRLTLLPLTVDHCTYCTYMHAGKKNTPPCPYCRSKYTFLHKRWEIMYFQMHSSALTQSTTEVQH